MSSACWPASLARWENSRFSKGTRLKKHSASPSSFRSRSRMGTCMHTWEHACTSVHMGTGIHSSHVHSNTQEHVSTSTQQEHAHSGICTRRNVCSHLHIEEHVCTSVHNMYAHPHTGTCTHMYTPRNMCAHLHTKKGQGVCVWTLNTGLCFLKIQFFLDCIISVYSLLWKSFRENTQEVLVLRRR